ncbi:MAG: RDD family protein [Clostridiaceae bacterium]
MVRDEYASLFKRLLAYIIDTLLLAIIFVPILWYAWFDDFFAHYSTIKGFTKTEEFATLKYNMRMGGFIVYCIYSLLLEGSRLQGTIGKRILGFLLALFSSKNMGLHDKISSTVVVQD